MNKNKRYNLNKIISVSLWILLGAGLVVLLVAAITRHNNESIVDIKINIDGVQNQHFIDKTEVRDLLEKKYGKSLKKASVGSLNLVAMEKALHKNQWIKEVELFVDNNNILQINIMEREPVARIFTIGGSSFYMDSSLKKLPLSDKFSARLPVFTNFPLGKRGFSKKDSALLKQIKWLGEYIGQHEFWMAQIEQIDITPARKFELIPKLGNQVIRIGTAENYKEKFNKLSAFYRKVQIKTGWNMYSALDLRYKDQVIGVRRDQQEIIADSLRVIQIMKQIIEEAKQKINDSSQIQLPQQNEYQSNIKAGEISSGNVEQNINPGNTIDVTNVTPIHHPEKPFLKKESTAPNKPVVENKNNSQTVRVPEPDLVKKKPVVKKRVVKKPLATEELKKPEQKKEQKPKAVMPPKNDPDS